MYDIENNLPKFIQRKVHVKRAVVKPNEGTASFIQKVLYPLNFLGGGHFPAGCKVWGISGMRSILSTVFSRWQQQCCQ